MKQLKEVLWNPRADYFELHGDIIIAVRVICKGQVRSSYFAFCHHHQTAMATRHKLTERFLEEFRNSLEGPLNRFIFSLIQNRYQFSDFLQSDHGGFNKVSEISMMMMLV